ncbi:hypothetical protein GB937_004045 [Aspergillus fischeri]|nr:hypothetical protein GB937_004045 [Aspergillus fischeri]
MDYHAEPIRSTTKVSIVLDKPDDWWTWDSYIIGLARTRGVLDILQGERPYPVPPIRPIHPMILANQQARTAIAEPQSASERPQAMEASQSDGSSTAAAAPTAPAKPTDIELAIYTEELAIYKEDKEQYRLDRQGLAAIWTTMEQTVAREYLQRLTSQSDSEVERYQKLKADLKPSVETRINEIQERYQKLTAKPANQNVSSWLSEWERVLSVCTELNMTQYTGYMGTRTFLTALKKIESQYASIRLDRLLEDSKLNVFNEISRYRKHWESLSQKEQKNPIRIVDLNGLSETTAPAEKGIFSISAHM